MDTNQKMRIVAIMILYKPNLREVNHNMLSVLPFVEKLILWQNSESHVIVPDEHREKVLTMGDGTNKYIAEPLNHAVQYCKDYGYNYLLTMDQDSFWPNLDSFITRARSLCHDDIAIFAPNINGEFANNGEFAYEVESVITSGSLHNISAVSRLGGFREDYQIYWVDGEFCFWARKNGFKIFVLPEHVLKHQFGNPTKEVLGFHGANYSAVVYYFLFRNMLWLRREFKEAVSVKTILHTMRLYIPGIILCEADKVSKLKNVALALYDGMTGTVSRRKSRQLNLNNENK